MTLEARLSKAKSDKRSTAGKIVQPETEPKQKSKAAVIDEEALRLAAERQKKMEEEREAQERAEAALKIKAQNKRDDVSIDRFFHKSKEEDTKLDKQPPEEEEERERQRILRSVSGRHLLTSLTPLGRGLFTSGGQAFKKKSLKELEEDRVAWREREEARRQKEAEERRRKQEELQRRDEQVC